jgi:hypothetical protein
MGRKLRPTGVAPAWTQEIARDRGARISRAAKRCIAFDDELMSDLRKVGGKIRGHRRARPAGLAANKSSPMLMARR